MDGVLQGNGLKASSCWGHDPGKTLSARRVREGGEELSNQPAPNICDIYCHCFPCFLIELFSYIKLCLV